MYHNISFGGHINNTLIKVGEKQNANTNDRNNLRDIDLIAYSIQFFYCGRTRFAALMLDSRCNSLRRLSHSLSWTWICLTLGFPSKTCPCRCASILTHIHIIVNVRKYIYIFLQTYTEGGEMNFKSVAKWFQLPPTAAEVNNVIRFNHPLMKLVARSGLISCSTAWQPHSLLYYAFFFFFFF